MKVWNVLIVANLLAGRTLAAPIEPAWESLAAHYQAPQWFVDGKIGVWMHRGISSAVDANRPNDGSWYGRNMYSGGKALAKALCEWHTQRYGPPAEFGYEKLIPLFKAEKWDPDSLVAFVKANGARPWKSFGEGPLQVKDGRQGENHKDFSQEDIRFTAKHGVLYAFVLAPPTQNIVIKTLASGGLLDREIAGVELMGGSESIQWNRSADALTIQLPKALPGQIVNGFRIHSE